MEYTKIILKTTDKNEALKKYKIRAFGFKTRVLLKNFDRRSLQLIQHAFFKGCTMTWEGMVSSLQ